MKIRRMFMVLGPGLPANAPKLASKGRRPWAALNSPVRAAGSDTARALAAK